MFVIITILLLLINHLEKEAVLTEVKDKITGLSEILAYSSVKAIVSEDFLELQGLIESIKRKEDVIEVSILNREGKILSSTNVNNISDSIENDLIKNIQLRKESLLQEGFTNENKSYLEVISPIYSIEDVLGYAVIKVSLERAYNQLEKTQNMIIFIGIFAIITTFIISFYLSNKITHPISKLSELVKEFGKGNFSTRSEVDTKDEIGELSTEFNQMAENIINLEKKLLHEERLSALGKTASAIAHELKTPLTSLQAYAEKLSSKLDDKTFLNNFRDIILSEVKRLNNLINNLLRFSKKEDLNIQKVKINDTINHVISILDEKVNKKNIKIEFANENDIEIECDKDKIVQVFLNIINNAVEAVDARGSIIINKKYKDEYSNNNIIIEIIDNGKGILSEHLPKLFEPFFSTKAKGTGLGLAICDKLIKMHNGVIKVESKEGEGSKFIIVLPIKHEG
jgi:signal transduction histidine kinase